MSADDDEGHEIGGVWLLVVGSLANRIVRENLPKTNDRRPETISSPGALMRPTASGIRARGAPAFPRRRFPCPAAPCSAGRRLVRPASHLLRCWRALRCLPGRRV